MRTYAYLGCLVYAVAYLGMAIISLTFLAATVFVLIKVVRFALGGGW